MMMTTPTLDSIPTLNAAATWVQAWQQLRPLLLAADIDATAITLAGTPARGM
jgi:hypothetical protein